MLFTKDNLNELLRNNVLTITFTKTDGTERVMKCTLLGEYMPHATANGQVLLKEDASKNNLAVWDVDINAWRSFRPDTVKKVTVG